MDCFDLASAIAPHGAASDDDDRDLDRWADDGGRPLPTTTNK